MANIVITTEVAGKCVKVDFGDLPASPDLPFITSSAIFLFKGSVNEVAVRDGYMRIHTQKNDPYDLYPHMVDAIDGTPIATMAELELAVLTIVNNNLV